MQFLCIFVKVLKAFSTPHPRKLVPLDNDIRSPRLAEPAVFVIEVA